MTQFRAAVPRFEFDIVLTGAHVGQGGPARARFTAAGLHYLRPVPLLPGFMAYSIIFRCSEPFLRRPTSSGLARYHYNTV